MLAALAAGVSGCRKRVESRFSAGDGGVGSAREDAAMLEADFAKLNNLPNNFPLELSPPTVLLDSRFSSNGQDVLVTVTQPEGVAGAPWNVLEIASGNANFRDLGVSSGDTVKLYMFPDSESRERQNATGEIDAQMVSHEATDLVVAQVLGDRRLQVVDSVRPPRDLTVWISEEVFANQPGVGMAGLDTLRDLGKVTAFGVKIPAENLPLNILAESVPTIAWPPRIEIWRVKDERMKAINRALGAYAKNGEPPLGWEPTPDAQEITRLTESFNRWLRSRTKAADSVVQPPARVETLPEALRNDAVLQDYLSGDALNRNSFADHEGRLIQQAAWCRDIGSWAAGDAFDPLPRATRLFDWVVRNVTLTDSPRVRNHHPWETLLYGRGGAAQRAWLFAQLCRQQRIDCCVVTLPIGEGSDEWLWCGVVDHGELYLFDPQLGLALTTPADEPIALSSLREDPSLLRGFDRPDSDYPVSADALAQASFAVVSEPLTMSSRAAQLQEQQSGSSAIVLHVDADAAAEQLQQAAGVDEVGLWPHPLANLRRELRIAGSDSVAAEKTRSAAALDLQPFAWTPQLWKARMLHIRGMLETEREAKKKGVLHDPIDDHRAAAQLYLSPRVRPSEKKLDTRVLNAERLRIYHRNKADATLWLGVLKHDQGEYTQAAQWFERVDTESPENTHLADAVRYGRARALEALGQREEAARLLSEDTSPQRFGNQIRAARLLGAGSQPAE
ncbi:transglutaminase domain-containing protein [Posidoniimonas polymericola]|nr:transglutaminase domain-containing protein [Posidoniimonas polymericola]